MTASNTPVDIKIANNYAYVVARGPSPFSAGSEFYIYDISNPLSPSLESSLSTDTITPSSTDSRSLFVSGSYAYVTNTNGNVLLQIYIGIPTSPSIVNTYSSGIGTNPRRVFFFNPYIYLVNYGATASLQIIHTNYITPIGATGGINVNLDFCFQFYGYDYSAIGVSAYGWMTFDTLISLATPAIPTLPSTTPPNNLIVPYSDGTLADQIMYYVSGTSPNRQYIFQWDNTTPSLSFQAILYETTNRIEFRWGSGTVTGIWN
jgi:hypothetical protein